MTTSTRARVLIVQAVIPHYRRTLFELLHRRLWAEGVELRVSYGEPNKEQAAKRDLVDLPAPLGLKVRNYWLADNVLYQSVLRESLEADLAILLNAAGHIVNYPIWFARRGTPKLAFWVFHTRARALDRSLKEAVSRRMMRAGRWWFAYTSGTREYLLSNGAPADRITVLNNSVDVSAFSTALAVVTPAELIEFAQRHGIPRDAPVGLFCGGLHRDKRLELLFDAVRRVHAAYPAFHLLVLGDGTQRDLAVGAAAQDARIHYLGPSFGKEKAIAFRLAHVFLCPGIVGLAVLDAFAAGLPLITTDIPNHSPEIDYLRHDRNGIVTRNDPEAYAQAVIGLLQSSARLRQLGAAALAGAGLYTVEDMAARFAAGITSCLGSGSF